MTVNVAPPDGNVHAALVPLSTVAIREASRSAGTYRRSRQQVLSSADVAARRPTAGERLAIGGRIRCLGGRNGGPHVASRLFVARRPGALLRAPGGGASRGTVRAHWRDRARGAEGVVFRARDTKADTVVALKLLGQDVSPERLGRFRRELALARKVTHPNVVRIYDLVEVKDCIGLSMELIHGETLGEGRDRRAAPRWSPRSSSGWLTTSRWASLRRTRRA